MLKTFSELIGVYPARVMASDLKTIATTRGVKLTRKRPGYTHLTFDLYIYRADGWAVYYYDKSIFSEARMYWLRLVRPISPTHNWVMFEAGPSDAFRPHRYERNPAIEACIRYLVKATPQPILSKPPFRALIRNEELEQWPEE